MRNASVLFGCLLLGIAVQAQPVETQQVRRRAHVDEPVVLRTHAHWDANCKSSTDARIVWVNEATHGKVEQTVDMVKGGGNLVGSTNCAGVEMRGIKLIYRPEPGFKGTDTLAYDVRYDARRPVVRFEFVVVVE